METGEFAETYSQGERVRFLLAGVLLGIAASLVGKLWLFPWVAEYADTAQCRTVLGVNGVVVLWYALFVGLPLSCAIAVGLGIGRHGIAILRDGQYPHRGAKVFRPTRIRKGAVARRLGYLHLLACVPFLALAIWGHAQAVALSKRGHIAPVKCATGSPSRHALLRAPA